MKGGYHLYFNNTKTQKDDVMAKKLYLTAKTKLTPTPEQTDLLWQTSDSARRLYNLALEQQQTVFIQRKRRVSHFEQKRELPHVRREYFPELHSQTAQEVIFDLEEAYKSFLSLLRTDKTARPPRFRGRKYFYTLTYPQKSYHLEDDAIVLHNPKGWLKIDFAEGYIDIPRVKALKQVEISEKDGNYYACITCEVLPERQVTTGKEIAFDPGAKTLLVGYDGEKILNVESTALKKTAKYYDKALDAVKSKLDRSKRGSKRHRRLVRAKKRLLNKRSRRLKQINHSISKELTKMGYVSYYIGDWSKKQSLADTGSKNANKRINRVVQNQLPVAKLVDYLTYKANLKSCEVSKVNEANSTNTCSDCGHLGEKLHPSIRTFRCKNCGLEIDRDENAAINLYKWYAAKVTGPTLIKSRMSIKFVFGPYNKCLKRIWA
jgi:putative transposase